MKFLLLTTAALLSLLVDIKAQPIVGESNLVPNGSFELLSQDEAAFGPNAFWTPRNIAYSLFWRQFHRVYLLNEVRNIMYHPMVKPPEYDRIYPAPGNVLYEPVCCSTTDLFSKHLIDCEPSSKWGDHYDIPENYFGNEDLFQTPQPDRGRYAGLYYRLNGVRKIGPNNFERIDIDNITLNFETELWREYLEVELTRPLEQGKQYTISFRASLAEVSIYAIPLECRLSVNPYTSNDLDDCYTLVNDTAEKINDNDASASKVLIPTTINGPGISTISPQIVNKNGWVEVTHQITANGGEKYLTIGNFQQVPDYLDAEARPARICLSTYYEQAVDRGQMARDICYMYIDDVKVTEQIVCECGPRICFLFTRTESDVSGKCCYKVSVVNGHRENLSDPIPAVCNIHSLVFFDNTSNQELFQWSANATEGPLTGDGIWRDIGTLCVNTFPLLTSKSIRISIRGPNGIEFCSQLETIDGCGGENECGCKEFRSSVKVTATSSQGSGCCYRVSIDASMIENCTIGSVYVYEGNFAHPNSEIVSGRHTTSVPSSFSGVLYTFCPPSPFSQASAQTILLQFRDLAGNPICEVVRNISCECRCGSTTSSRQAHVSIEFEPISSDPGQCCYNLRLRNDGVCRFLVNSFKLYINDNQPIISPVMGWTSSGSAPILTLSRTTGTLSLAGGESSLVGTICIPTCVVFDPRVIRTTASLIVEGQECNVPITVRPVPACGGDINCNDVVIAVKKHFPNVIGPDACCRFVEVSLDNCLGKQDGLSVEVYDEAGRRIGVSVADDGKYESVVQCRSWLGQAYTVQIRRTDGTLLCTKPVVMPICTLPSHGS